ncbi:MAG: bZIP transcription factor [Verrucomicrobiales bacterium]|nr:bZIP transcription factor [Verrucomicrobiales bacterium]
MSAANIAKDAIRIAHTAGLSKDVIDLLERKITLLSDQVTSLETENASLQAKIDQLEREPRDDAPILKHRGVAFHRRKDGSIEDTVYCPKCESPLFSASSSIPMTCHCGFVAPFKVRDIPTMISEIEAETRA